MPALCRPVRRRQRGGGSASSSRGAVCAEIRQIGLEDELSAAGAAPSGSAGDAARSGRQMSKMASSRESAPASAALNARHASATHAAGRRPAGRVRPAQRRPADRRRSCGNRHGRRCARPRHPWTPVSASIVASSAFPASLCARRLIMLAAAPPLVDQRRPLDGVGIDRAADDMVHKFRQRRNTEQMNLVQ